MTRSLLASSMQARSISSQPPASEPHVPHCPWQNGKVERFNRTLASEWAYRQVFISNADRAAALPDFLDYYNHRRRHSAIGGQPPISRLSPT
jgi:transposase InsO family protein